MKREHAVTIVLALFAAWIASVGADAPKFGDIPNPAGMNYGWDATNNTVRALAVDADGNLQSEATNASTTPANVILRDGTSGAQIGTTTNPLTVTGTMTATVVLPVASSAVSAPTDALPVMLYANDNSALQRLFTAIVQGDGVNGNNMLPQAQYLYNGSTFDRGQVKYDRVVSAVNAKIDSVATNTASIISTIASITPPCTVQISCPAGELWYAPGLATTTIGSIKYHILEEKQSVTFDVATSNWDISVGGVSAVSSCSVSVHSTVQ